MGRQIGFYATDEDYITLLRLATKTRLLFIPEVIPKEVQLHAVLSREFEIPAGQSFFYMLPEEVGFGALQYEPSLSDSSVLKLNANRSPVIQFKPCIKKNEFLYNGRFYLKFEKEHHLYSTILQRFNKLHSLVYSWSSTNRFGFHVGPHTRILVESGKIRLMHHLIELFINEDL